MKKLINMITTVIIFLLVVLLLLLNVTKLFGIMPYAVTSGSMRDLYPVGSLIYVKKVDPQDIVVGDSITFNKDNNVVATHQVYEIDEVTREFKTQGINNVDTNGQIIHDASPVSFDSLIGKPVFCIPFLGYVNVLLANSFAKITVIGIAVVMIILSMIFG